MAGFEFVNTLSKSAKAVSKLLRVHACALRFEYLKTEASASFSQSYLSGFLQGEQSIALIGFSPIGLVPLRGTPTFRLKSVAIPWGGYDFLAIVELLPYNTALELNCYGLFFFLLISFCTINGLFLCLKILHNLKSIYELQIYIVDILCQILLQGGSLLSE